MIDRLIDGIIDREGGYVYHDADRGGPTRWGITEAVAREAGYLGEMREFPVEYAREIYRDKYFIRPGFDKVAELSPAVADELTDTGANMGPVRAVQFLQRALNAFNRKGLDYPDIQADGLVGPATLRALKAYLDKRRSQNGEAVLVRALDCLQGAKYIAIAEADTSQEAFVFGWISSRVGAW